MPAAVPFIVTAAATAAGLAPLAVAALTIVSSIAVSLYEADRAKKKARDAYNDSLQDRLITVRSGVSPRKYVLGTVRTGGTLMYIESIGSKRDGLDSVTAFACNKCEVIGYYIGDDFVSVEDFPGEKYGRQQVNDFEETFVRSGPTATVTISSTPVPGSVRAFKWILTINDPHRRGQELPVLAVDGTSVTIGNVGTNEPIIVAYQSRQGDKLRIQYKNGDPNQTATAHWAGYINNDWGPNHRLRGVAYARTLMRWDQNIYQNGAPPIGAVLMGGWVEDHAFYDPRPIPGNPLGTFPEFTDNPAILAAWWMTLPRNRGGMGIPSEWIDWDSVAIAANICDETIEVKRLSGEGTEFIRRYRCNTVLSTEHPPADNLDIILSAMDGRRVFTAGKYRIYAGAFRTATLTITDSDIIGDKPIQVATSSGDDAPPNIVTARFADATQNWIETSPPEVRNQAYIDNDGHESPLDISLPATTDPRHANYLMGIALERARPAFSVTLTVGGIGEDIALGDTVQLDISNRPAYAGKTFEVISITDHWNGEFELTLVEIRPQTWALDPNSWTPKDPVRLPDLRYLWDVQPIQGFTVTLGSAQTTPDGNTITRVELSWDPPPEEGVAEGGRIELRYREVGFDWIQVGSVPGTATTATLSLSLVDDTYYYFQARVVNGIGASSDWVGQWVHVEGTPLADGVQGPGIFTWADPSGVTTTSNSITKTAASGAFDAGAYSLQSYSVGCFLTCRPGETDTDKIIGLNDDPAVDHDQAGINYAWRARADGTLESRLSGGSIQTHGAYTDSTVLSITYDGANVRFLVDGNVVRTVAASGLRLFLDVSLYTEGASWQDIAFGPQGAAGPPGPAGAAAQSLRLVASAYVFTFNSAGQLSPPNQSITFQAVRQNIPQAAVFSATPSVSITGSGDTRTLTGANFGSNTAVKIRAEAGGFFDEVTVVRLQEGATGQSALQLLLTNQAHTLAADADGTVANPMAANGRMILFEGITDRTAEATLEADFTTGMTLELNTADNTPIAGQPKGYYRVTAITADQASTTLRATYNGQVREAVFNVTRARRGEPGSGANMLEVEAWKVGTSGTQGQFVQRLDGPTGTQNNNSIVLGGAGTAPVGPFETTEPIWQVHLADANVVGWDYRNIPIDPKKTYRASVWLRVSKSEGRPWFGARVNGGTLNLDGTLNTNPYFVSLSSLWTTLEANQWYFAVGIIHGSDYNGGSSGISGLYDPRTGKRVFAGTDYKMAPDATTQTHRVYFSQATQAQQWMARPRFEEINGNEPSIYDLMGLQRGTPWVERGNCIAGPNSFHKLGGSAAWDSDVYSVTSYQTCHLQFKAGQTNANLMVGLNQDPASNESYTSIDFAFYVRTSGNLETRVNGSSAQNVPGGYTTNTELAITYDGTNVRYYRDRVLVRTVSAPGLRLALDSSFNTPNGSITNVKWGPGTEFESISTGEMDLNAVTEPPVIVEAADGSRTYPSATQPLLEPAGLDSSAAYTAPQGINTQVQVSWSVQGRISSNTSGIALGEAFLYVRVLINGSQVWERSLSIEGYRNEADWALFSGSRDFIVPGGQQIQVLLQSGRRFVTSGFSPAQTMFWRGAIINLTARKR